MIIRKMKEQDTTAVAKIEEINFAQPWSANAFCESLANKDTLFLVAQEEKEILGYIGMYISLDEGVSPKNKRKHVATKLIENIIELAQKKQVSRIILEVRKTNTPAIKAYEKQGFKIVGVRKNFYEKPIEDAYIMDVNI